MSDSCKLVELYDLNTHRSTTIPAAELAPGMVQIRIEGKEGTYWMDPKKVKTLGTGPFRHPPFKGRQRAKIKEIMRLLREVYPLTFKEWVDGFRRDIHVDEQIAQWSLLADVYSNAAGNNKLDSAGKKSLFHVLLACQSSAYEHIWHVINPGDLPKQIVTATVEQYYGQPKLKKELALVDPEDFRDDMGNIPLRVTEFESPAARETLKSVDIVFGVDAQTGNRSLFFGDRCLKEICFTGEAKILRSISVLYDARTNQLEYLYALVKVLKGSCCYGKAVPLN